MPDVQERARVMSEQLYAVIGEPLPPTKQVLDIGERHLEEHAAQTVSEVMRPVTAKIDELETLVNRLIESNRKLGGRVEVLTTKLYRLESNGGA